MATSLFPDAAMLPKPPPRSVDFQTNRGPSAGHSFRRPVSADFPSLCAPRHCDHSGAAARRVEVRTGIMPNVSSLCIFVMLYQSRAKSKCDPPNHGPRLGQTKSAATTQLPGSASFRRQCRSAIQTVAFEIDPHFRCKPVHGGGNGSETHRATPSDRNGGRVNLVAVDGHAEALKPDELDGNSRGSSGQSTQQCLVEWPRRSKYSLAGTIPAANPKAGVQSEMVLWHRGELPSHGLSPVEMIQCFSTSDFAS
jgi:hypothetical protein